MPGLCPEYGPTYYAVKFEDQDEQKLGIDHSLSAYNRKIVYNSLVQNQILQ